MQLFIVMGERIDGGDGAEFVRGVFSTREKAETWLRNNPNLAFRASGTPYGHEYAGYICDEFTLDAFQEEMTK